MKGNKKAGNAFDPVEEDNDKGNSGADGNELSEEARLANLNALMKRGGPGKKGQKMKSPKAEKKNGKQKTTWDPFMFGGRGATGAEAKSLERGPKNTGEQDGEAERAATDRQMAQFVPDSSVIGASASQFCQSFAYLGKDLFDLYFMFVFSAIRQLEEESEEDYDIEEEAASGNATSATGGSAFWSSLTSLVGKKALDSADIAPVISKMQDLLISKNVASEVAVKLCDSVASNLEGKVLGE